MAVLHAKGELKVGDRFIGRSIIGSEFRCRIEGRLHAWAARPAIVPSISGRAWITEVKQLVCDPTDPWPRGTRV